ncbi:MAG: GH3 auxin-responsive promoter family protein [Saprospiraceae bacterium]|nr:GH3 auxin-responsive promoter family protein [Saprospiraceae bacterium]
MYNNPVAVQKEVYNDLLNNLKTCEYGKKFRARDIKSIEDYKKAFPVVNYEKLFPYIDRMMHGETDILWPGKVCYFAKSSGTTNDRSKYIPFTDEILDKNHVNSSWDAMSILYNNRPDARIFDRKNLLMGGSLSTFEGNKEVVTGDVSALLLHKMPAVGRPFYTPDFETALLKDWETKIEKMAKHCAVEDVVMFGGVPTWTIALFNRILELTGKKNMLEVWPNVKTYIHGGVGFDPYWNQFKEFLPSDEFEYYEVYNASEGYFAFQDRKGKDGMLLLLDNATYFEFMPLSEIDKSDPETLNLLEIEEGTEYALVISNASGLWRYMPGDVVRIIEKNPLRIKVCGRTKHYINVFGEEVMVGNTDQAIKEACVVTGAAINDYTVAPVFMNSEGKGGHQWLIEFKIPPQDIDHFALLLDKKLREINSDYDAKRSKDIALQNLIIESIPMGTFQGWLASKGRLGGQSKIPRLSNERKYLEQILEFATINL